MWVFLNYKNISYECFHYIPHILVCCDSFLLDSRVLTNIFRLGAFDGLFSIQYPIFSSPWVWICSVPSLLCISSFISLWSDRTWEVILIYLYLLMFEWSLSEKILWTSMKTMKFEIFDEMFYRCLFSSFDLEFHLT